MVIVIAELNTTINKNRVIYSKIVKKKYHQQCKDLFYFYFYFYYVKSHFRFKNVNDFITTVVYAILCKSCDKFGDFEVVALDKNIRR